MNRLITLNFLVGISAMFLTVAMPLAASRASEAPAGNGPAYNVKKDRLSQTRYYTLKPFTLPLLANGQVVEHFTLVVSMELGPDDNRAELARRVPRIRDSMYQTLFQMVTFRRRGAPIPDVDMFKERLLKVALKVAGSDLVKGILVQQAFKQAVQ